MLKKTTFALCSLIASELVFAGTMGPVCTPGQVTVPCQAELWELGADALYLQSLYGADKGFQLARSNASWQEIKTDWDWGYRLKGAYHFGTGSDFSVNWMHFKSSIAKNNLISAANPVIPLSLTKNLRSHDRFDQVNLVLGQHVDMSSQKKVRFYAGLQYADIQTTATNYLNIILENSAVNQYDNTSFRGVGPTMGLDYAYYLTPALSITANGSGAMLYGPSHYHMGYVVQNFNAVIAESALKKRLVVPALEAKLGLNYGYPFAQGLFNVEAGYQVVNYFSPLKTQFMDNIANPIRPVNYGLYGPYFGLKYVANA